MIIKNVTYRGVSLSDTLSKANHVVLQEEVHTLNLRTETYEKQTYHGAYSSHTLAEGRLFTFSGYVFGATKADRFIGQNILNAMCALEPYPSDTNRGFYELSFENDAGVQMKVMAKVYSKPDYKNSISDKELISFDFELYCEDPNIYGMTTNSASGLPGSYGGNKLFNKLPGKLNNMVNDFSVSNTGDFPAPCSIRIQGTRTNPKVLIGDRFFQVNSTTTDLTISTIGGLSVVDNGVNKLSLRAPGSKSLFISPGSNVILVTSDDTDLTGVTVTVTWNDTSL